MPNTKLGKWSLGLIIAMPLLFVLGSSTVNTIYKGVANGGTLWGDIFARPLLSGTMLIGMGAGIAAFILGLLGITKQKERSWLVYLATAIGAFLIVFLIGEFFEPGLQK